MQWDGIPQIIWTGMASPNKQVSRVDAIAVASPNQVSALINILVIGNGITGMFSAQENSPRR
jgi:hypothetical protein